MRVLTRELIEATARIIPNGAAALALEASKQYVDPVFIEDVGQIVVLERAA